MAEKAKPFSAPLPLRAISDQRLSGLDLRVLAAVAYHDRMSLFRGQGQGCWASHETLSGEIGCNYINLGKAIKKLGQLGYVERHQPTFPDKARRHVYRIPAHLYAHAESLSFGKVTTHAQQGDSIGQVGEMANQLPGEVCHDLPENQGITDTSLSQYISLSDEIYSSEEGKNIPLEEAHSSDSSKMNGAEAPARQWALKPHLPANFAKLPPGAMLQRFEEAFEKIGRDPDSLESRERQTFSELLFGLSEDHAGANEAIANQARRLWEEVAVW